MICFIYSSIGHLGYFPFLKVVVSTGFTIVYLNTKGLFKMKHTFIELNKTSYSESIGAGSSPNNVLIRKQRQEVFMRQRITSVEGQHFYWCREHKIVILTLSNAFNFQSSSDQLVVTITALLLPSQIVLWVHGCPKFSPKIILPGFNIPRFEM